MLLNPPALRQCMVRHAEFSGVVQVRSEVETVFAEGYGYANRADRLPNTINTRFGIASGTKLLTGVAICQLVEEGGLALETRLQDVVDAAFPQFDPAITVRHLLTHTSGAPDYFDEEDSATAEYGELWTNRPTYTMRRLRDFLPMFQNEPMKYAPGERFSYNNGGYILLGLIIEAITGRTYIDYVTEHVLLRAGMADSGFYPLDQLPERTALGYVDLEDGSWRTNTFELPIIGASDGGVFATAPDVGHFWDALFAYRLLGPEMTMQFLHPHVATDPTEDNTRYYGYGIWMRHADGKPIRYYGVGSDPGASFMSARFPAQLVEVTVISNTGDGAWPVFEGIKALI